MIGCNVYASYPETGPPLSTPTPESQCSSKTNGCLLAAMDAEDKGDVTATHCTKVKVTLVAIR